MNELRMNEVGGDFQPADASSRLFQEELCEQPLWRPGGPLADFDQPVKGYLEMRKYNIFVNCVSLTMFREGGKSIFFK